MALRSTALSLCLRGFRVGGASRSSTCRGNLGPVRLVSLSVAALGGGHRVLGRGAQPAVPDLAAERKKLVFSGEGTRDSQSLE